MGATKPEDEVNWLDDLKFFIDNDTDVLSKQFFPAIRRHQAMPGPDAYKFYMNP